MEEPKKKIDDNGSDKTEKKKEEELKVLVLTISRDLKTGVLNVEGPGNGKIYDHYTCFGLMEDGKDFIKRHNMIATASKIVRPNFGQRIQNRFKGAFGK